VREEGVSIAFNADGIQRHIRRSAELLARELKIAGSTDLWAAARRDAHQVLSSLFDSHTANRAIQEADGYFGALSKANSHHNLNFLPPQHNPYGYWTLFLKQFQIQEAAKQLGYSKANVKWTYVPFNKAFAPGAKDFDFDINQVSWPT